MSKIPIRIIAVSSAVAEIVRETGKSPRYGHPAHKELATGYGPCRHCLKAFVQGAEDRILFTYNPFGGSDDVPLPGPIFIHAAECERYPENGGYPEGLRQFPSVIDGYGDDQKLLAQIRVDNEEQPDRVQSLLERAAIRYLHVRDKRAGCFDFRVERA